MDEPSPLFLTSRVLLPPASSRDRWCRIVCVVKGNTCGRGTKHHFGREEQSFDATLAGNKNF